MMELRAPVPIDHDAVSPSVVEEGIPRERAGAAVHPDGHRPVVEHIVLHGDVAAGLELDGVCVVCVAIGIGALKDVVLDDAGVVRDDTDGSSAVAIARRATEDIVLDRDGTGSTHPQGIPQSGCSRGRRAPNSLERA